MVAKSESRGDVVCPSVAGELIFSVLTARMVSTQPGVSISFIVSGWFCEVGGCGKKGAVRRLFPMGLWRACFPRKL